jgi:hypothetical protein
MQIKAILRFHLTSVRMAIFKSKKQHILARLQENKNPYILLVGMQISTTTMESSMKIPQKVRENWHMILIDTQGNVCQVIHRCLCTNVHCFIIHSSQAMGKTNELPLIHESRKHSIYTQRSFTRP